MTKIELEQLRALPAEIKAMQDNIDNLPVVVDSVTGSRPYIPFDKHSITIKGVDTKRLSGLKAKLETKLDDLQDEIERMEDWLGRIEDSEMRTILRLRYRNGLSWTEIGVELGYERTTVSKKEILFWRNYEAIN